MAVAKVSAEAPTTYYPMTPSEVLSMRELKLNPAARDLLMLIKSYAPFGKKLFFSETLNEVSIRESLKMDRWTFLRAKKLLLQRQLIEFNSYYMMDLHSVDRTQFKRKEETPSEEKSQALPSGEQFLLPSQGAESHPMEQDCTQRSPGLNTSNASGALKNIQKPSLSTNEKERTTKHSPATRPVVVHPPTATGSNSTELTEEELHPHTSASLSNASESPRSKPKDPKVDQIFPGEFLQFETILKSIGVKFNQNLLKAFYEAGVEKVRRVINYVKERVEKAKPGDIPSVAGYIVKALRNFEEWGLSKRDPKEDRRILIEWRNAAKAARLIDATFYCDQRKDVYVVFKDGTQLQWEEAMAKYPMPSPA